MIRSNLGVMILIPVLMFFISLNRIDLTKSECTSTSTDSPIFSKPMESVFAILEGKTHRLDCCMYGIDKIVWSFRPGKTVASWETFNKVKRLSDGNRTLEIRDPKKYKNTGDYQCLGTNGMGQSLEGESYVKVVSRMSDLSLKMVPWPQTNHILFKTASTKTLFCVVQIFESFRPHFMWYRDIEMRRVALTKDNRLLYNQQEPLLNGYKGYSQVTMMRFKRHLIIYNFTLTLSTLNYSHRGFYGCEIGDGTMNISQNFVLDIKFSDNRSIYALIGIILCFHVLCFLLYIFRVDMEIFLKNIIKIHIFKDYPLKKYDFFFVYNFEDIEEYKIIQNVVNYLAARGYSSYFHHRDQTYGRDFHDGIFEKVKSSNVVVIWASRSFVDNNKCKVCIELIINTCSNIKRIYVMTAKKEEIISQVRRRSSKRVVADLTSRSTSKIFVLDSFKDVDKTKSSLILRYSYRQFIGRLISALPIKSFH